MEQRVITLSSVIDAYNAAYDGLDPSRATRLAFWDSQLGQLDIAAIDADMVEDAMDELASRGRMLFVRGKGLVPTGKPHSPATLNRYITSLGAVFRFARKKRLLPRGHVPPTRGVEKHRESGGRLIYLTEEQVERVIACAALARWGKLAALIRLAFTTGLRKGSLMGLRWRDVDLEARRVTVERTKNGRPHVAHLTPAMVEALKAMPGHRLPSGLVFSGHDEQKAHDFRKSWEVACREAGLLPTPFHAVRHSTASHLAARGASSVLLADTLGHSSLRMVARYAHLSIDARARAIEDAFA
jgi:integrase